MDNRPIDEITEGRIRYQLEEELFETQMCESCEADDCFDKDGDCPFIAIVEEVAEQIYQEGITFMRSLLLSWEAIGDE